MNEFFEDIKFIIAFSSYSIFKTEEEKTVQTLFYSKGKETDAKGFYNENGFTVLKGSIIANTVVKSYANPNKREELLKKYAEIRDGKTILSKNIEFKSPSTAAGFCLGSSSNGWTTWKTEDEETLGQVFRN